MQRGLDDETKKQLEEEEQRIISDEHWYLDLPELEAKENHIIEVPYSQCEEQMYGHMSFGGFNPEVEKLMKVLKPKEVTSVEGPAEEEEETSWMPADVTDEEMALRYESLVGSTKKKFVKKRQRAATDEDVNQNVVETNTKRMFLKPQD
ncbi:M-phase phosphoprotein 6-like [Limanda limanda]|uniref:M-phase phosphoprotein 6-like n=1 Tax=Limanda limanda TaxID=27771 RepID=UPI0029C8BA21|nr:M-phase phosphoprotein 6-like [Limanda limanda]